MPTLGTLSAFGMSDIGHVRQNNEDAFVVMAEYGFLAIADGMGGHNGGEIAAHETVSHLSDAIAYFFKETELSCEKATSYINHAITKCNAYIHKLSRCNTSLRGMGTTLCAALFLDDHLIYAHVGDSRLYCLRHGKLMPMTTDHSLVNKVAEEECISIEKARTRVKKGVITRSIGTHKTVKPEIDLLPVDQGDTYLLCSDGLTDLVSDFHIENILNEPLSLEEATKKLIELAKSHGGKDNITIILARHDDDILR